MSRKSPYIRRGFRSLLAPGPPVPLAGRQAGLGRRSGEGAKAHAPEKARRERAARGFRWRRAAGACVRSSMQRRRSKKRRHARTVRSIERARARGGRSSAGRQLGARPYSSSIDRRHVRRPTSAASSPQSRCPSSARSRSTRSCILSSRRRRPSPPSAAAAPSSACWSAPGWRSCGCAAALVGLGRRATGCTLTRV